MEYIHTTTENSPQTRDKIILNTDLRHKLSDNTDHFTRNSNFLLYNSDLYSVPFSVPFLFYFRGPLELVLLLGLFIKVERGYDINIKIFLCKHLPDLFH